MVDQMTRFTMDEMYRLARSGVTKIDLHGQRGVTLVSCDELTAMAAVIALHVPLSGGPAPETSSHRREIS